MSQRFGQLVDSWLVPLASTVGRWRDYMYGATVPVWFGSACWQQLSFFAPFPSWILTRLLADGRPG